MFDVYVNVYIHQQIDKINRKYCERFIWLITKIIIIYMLRLLRRIFQVINFHADHYYLISNFYDAIYIYIGLLQQ